MKGKVIENDTCKIHFNYGVFSLKDSKFIKTVIHLFDRAGFHKTHPKLNDLNYFRKIYEIIENEDKYLEKYKSCLNLIHDENHTRIKLFKEILKYNNVYMKDDLILVLVNNENDDEALKKAVEELNKAEFNSTYVDSTFFNKKACLAVFLLTQRYYESELFIEHLDEAIQEKKEIVFITNKKDHFKINDDELKNFKIFKFEMVIFKHMFELLQKIHVSDETTKLGDFIRSTQKLVSDEILFLYHYSC